MQEKQYSKVYIAAPAFNEEKVLEKVISDIKKEGFKNIIIVDDGSTDNTYAIAKKLGCITLHHLINRGKGAGTQTALDAAKLLNAEVVVTMDADGQHLAKDIKNLVQPILDKQCDIVLGSRLIERKGMTLTRYLVNLIGNLVTYLFYGIYVSDSQSGFRAYSAKANEVVNTTMDRYEFESEILHQIKNADLKYVEVPIEVRYTKHSRTKWNDIPTFPRQRFINGFKMLYKMIVRSILS